MTASDHRPGAAQPAAAAPARRRTVGTAVGLVALILAGAVAGAGWSWFSRQSAGTDHGPPITSLADLDRVAYGDRPTDQEDAAAPWHSETSEAHLTAATPDVVVHMVCLDQECTWTGRSTTDGSAVWELHATGPVERSAQLDGDAGSAPWSEIGNGRRLVPSLFATFEAADDGTRVVHVRSAATGEPLWTGSADDAFRIAGDTLVVVDEAPGGCSLTVRGGHDAGPVATDCALLDLAEPGTGSFRTGHALYVAQPGANPSTIVVDLTTGETRSEQGATGFAENTPPSTPGAPVVRVVGAEVQVEAVRTSADDGAGGYEVRDARTGEPLWTLTVDDAHGAPRIIASGTVVVVEQPVAATLREKLPWAGPPVDPVRLDVYRATTGEQISSTRLPHSLWAGG